MDSPARVSLGGSLLRFPGPIIMVLIAATGAAALVPALGESLGVLGLVGGQIIGGFVILARIRRLDEAERKAWRLLAIALFLSATGVLAVGAWKFTIGDPPAFGATDIFFVAAYGFLIAALVSLARVDVEGASWTTTLLDALVGGVALAALVWTTFFHDFIEGFEAAGWWEPLIGFLYPVLDIVVVVGVMVLVIRRSHFRLDLRLVFLGLAMTVQVLADFVFLAGGVGRSFAEAAPPWPLNLLAVTLLLTTASLVGERSEKREYPQRRTPIWALIWPYLLAAALLATHAITYRTTDVSDENTVLLDALLIIVVIIFLRQIVEIRRQRRFVEHQRSELVASVSHELRTPLTAMVGYLTLLDENGDDFTDDARREMISDATGQARHMSRLVNDLVMFARQEMGSVLPLEISAVRISEVVGAALQNVESGSSRVEADIDQEAVVNIDPDRIRQLIVNLLSNAVRYGGGRVIVVVRTNRDLEIAVHDNGGGVPTRFQERIWDRFERGAHRLDAKSPGLGIGLSVVKAVAVSHGGRAYYIRSPLLGGACFTVVIPGAVATRVAAPRTVPVAF